MALTFPGIVRYSIVADLNGEDCVNIIDIKLDPDVGAGSRADIIEDVAGDLLNQWSDHILPLLSDNYVAQEVRWVDLNNSNGTVGTISSTDGSTWPETGVSDGPALPNNVYAKVRKNLAERSRNTRSGLLRLGGGLEGWTQPGDGNRLTVEQQASINTQFENLKDGINGTENGWTRNIGVLHTTDGAATGFSFVSSFTADPVVGTIRRRMPGYGS